MTQPSFSLMIHGGAGAAAKNPGNGEHALFDSMRKVLEAGRALLSTGGSAMDAVARCARLLEDDPLYNAGYGASPNSAGDFELDAAIMDGETLKAGAVAAVRNIRNPVDLARLVMDKTPHVLLAGEAAARFGLEHGIATVDKRYFEEALTVKRAVMEPSGTVGAIARDLHGNMAAATSTGGYGKKMPGRIGDTPIIGAGTYADNQSCAISCTGRGEDFIRTGLSKHIAVLIENGMTAAEAAQAGIDYIVRRVNGSGAFILIDNKGNVSCAQSSPIIRHGWIERGGETRVSLTSGIIPRV